MKEEQNIWMLNIKGALVVGIVTYVVASFTKWVAMMFLFAYIGCILFGPACCKFGIKSKKSMSEWDEIFATCKAVKSWASMRGLHKGEVLQYIMYAVPFQNAMILHNWYGKLFDANGNAAALIVRSWMGIPTFFKWNYCPIGLAKLKPVEFEGKESIAMQYRLLPITDHFREYVDDDGNECWLGVMVIFGCKLMYFKLFKAAGTAPIVLNAS